MLHSWTFRIDAPGSRLVASGGGAATAVSPGAAPEALLRVRPGVRQAEVADALRALRQIPAADRELLARNGVVVELLPQARTQGNEIGGTVIEQASSASPWRPTVIQVAAHANERLSPTSHIVAHEVGHAVEVLRSQDTSEASAERYVQRVLRGAADQALTAQRMTAEVNSDRRGHAVGGGGGAAPFESIAAGLAELLLAR